MTAHDWSKTENGFVLTRIKPSYGKLIGSGVAALAASALAFVFVGLPASVAVLAIGGAALGVVARRDSRSDRICVADGQIRLETSALMPGAWNERAAFAAHGVRRILLLEVPHARVGIELAAGSITWATSLPLAADRGEHLALAIADAVGAPAYRWNGDALTLTDD